MDIAAISMNLASTRLQLDVSTSVAKKVMESAEVNAQALTEMLEPVEQMMSGEHIIDTYA